MKLGDKVKVMVCGPGRLLDREGGQMKVNMIRMNMQRTKDCFTHYPEAYEGTIKTQS